MFSVTRASRRAEPIFCSTNPMNFESILFRDGAERARSEKQTQAPDYFVDLNIDQIIAALISSKSDYNLLPFFYAPLHDVDSVHFRHEVMHDLENPRLLHAVKAFAQSMQTVRAHLSELEKRYYEHQNERWFLDAVDLYCDAVGRLAEDLRAEHCRSRGFQAFRDYLADYVASPRFTALIAEAKRLKAELAAIRYSIFIYGSHVEVHHYADNPDYGAEIAATFERFRQGAAQGYAFRFFDSTEMDHVEAKILDGVAYLHKETFESLKNFRANNADFLDQTLVAFDREIQFYIAYLDYIAPLKDAGLAFCYPHLSISDKEVYDEAGFDLALAGKLVPKGIVPVCNDFYLKDPERIIVVSGPNQGGKTTFARTFGQLHYLAGLGLPVPGRHAQLYLPDRIFTHFEREEKMTNRRGKLEDDLVRIHEILEAATPRSLIIINEIFASAAFQDALFLSKKIATKITELDTLCVWVTFIDEIASLSRKTVSMVSTVVPNNPAQRTFKILRRPADGLAYAMSIAEKHRLTYHMILERTRRESTSALPQPGL